MNLNNEDFQLRVIKFESWLTNPVFIGLVLLFLLLNFLVYSKNIYHQPTNKQSLNIALDEEKQRLERMLKDNCENSDLKAFSRGEIGPMNGLQTIPKMSEIDPSNDIRTPVKPTDDQSATINKNDNQTPKSPEDLNSLLQAATVRVILPNGVGSGFFINNQVVVTNRHVIEGAKNQQIYIANKRLGSTPIKARVITATKDSKFFNPDLALLKIDTPSTIAVPLSISTNPVPLQSVVAAGYPYVSTRTDIDRLIPNPVLTTGEVSVLQPQSNGSIWVIHTAQIAPGSSGGSLVNRCGAVVGVNTLIGTGEGVADGRSLYALSASSLIKFLESSGESYVNATGSCATSRN